MGSGSEFLNSQYLQPCGAMEDAVPMSDLSLVKDKEKNQFMSDLDKLFDQEIQESGEFLSNVVEEEDHQGKKLPDELQGGIDAFDGMNMTKILTDLGFHGENLFTWHT